MLSPSPKWGPAEISTTRLLAHPATAMPCTSIIISGCAKPCTVMAALAGKSLPKSSARSSVMRVVWRASLRNTVMVTMSRNVAPACANVFSILRKVCRNWASKSPASDLPLSSACPVWPAMKIVRCAPCVITAGENARLACHVPRTKDFCIGLLRGPRRAVVGIFDRAPHPLRRRRHLDMPDAEVRKRIHQRIGDGGHGADASCLARALHPERIGPGRHRIAFDVDRADVGGARHGIVHE